MPLRCTITMVLNFSCSSALIAILAASASFAATAEQKAAFMSRCGSCHSERDIQYWGRQRADAAARQAWLDHFLRRHHSSSGSERALIINYLQSIITDQSAR